MEKVKPKLKPCPFCKKPPKKRVLKVWPNFFAVGCKTYGCDIRGPWKKTKQKAIQAWNKREG